MRTAAVSDSPVVQHMLRRDAQTLGSEAHVARQQRLGAAAVALGTCTGRREAYGVGLKRHW
jgi:hypothetical protein